MKKINNFWKKLKPPIMALAPMADVTDAAFREVIAKYGKPDVMFTEFVSADGLNSPGKDKLIIDFKYGEAERPIVAQIFGCKLENLLESAKLCKKLGFDGIDVNMGCPEKSICKQGCGAAMMQNSALARVAIRAVIQGGGGLPVSVKIRLGYLKKEEIEKFLPEILQENLAAVIIHARTKKEMSKVPADWSYIKRAVEIKNELKSKTLILGNGDVMNLDQANQRVKETGCDGVMIGRGIFGNPWLFNKETNREDLPLEQKLKVLVEHAKLFEKYFKGVKHFAIMKKHFKAYVNDFNGAKELRMKLMGAEDADAVDKIILEYLKSL